MKQRIFLFFIPFLLQTHLARADSVNGEWYSSTRALSMGNVGIAVVGDPAIAMFYNPAALGSNRGASV